MKIYIKGISYHLPEGILTNQELVESFPEWNAEKVANKVGIHQRHIAAEKETAGDLALIAAQNLFREYNISPDCIDFILFCTQSPDHYLQLLLAFYKRNCIYLLPLELLIII